MARCKSEFLYCLLWAVLSGACASNAAPSHQASSHQTQNHVPRPVAQTSDEIAFAKQVLSVAQEFSLIENIELCGYLLAAEDGALISTDLNRGEERSCNLPPIPPNSRVVSIFHSHGAYNPLFDRELPSYDDVQLSLDYVEDNYIVTPGGRVWYLDAREQTARILCGEGCLQADPHYEDTYTRVSKELYTRDELWRLGSNAFADDP